MADPKKTTTKSKKVVDRRAYDFFLVVRPADDAVWLAHCPQLDVMAQGDTPEHALEALREAVDMCVIADLNDDQDPCLARKADEKALDAAMAFFLTGRRTAKLVDDRRRMYLVVAPFGYECVQAHAERSVRLARRKRTALPVFSSAAAAA